jgi:hypothetical protein
MFKPNPTRDSRQPALSRRTVFVGASVAGAAVAAAAVLPAAAVVEKTPPSAGPQPSSTGGYQLTEHVQRYYRTAKV